MRPAPDTPTAPARVDATAQGSAPRKGLVYRAIPNDRQVAAKTNAAGQPAFTWPGRTVIPAPMKIALSQQADTVLLDHAQPVPLPAADWVVNTLADPDVYSFALGHLAAHLAQSPSRVFNAPQAVLGTYRDHVARTLSGIDGLIAPHCLRFRPKHPDHFQAAFDKGGFRFPVLVRIAGTQSGISLIKIDDPSEWTKIFQIPWGGRDVYMTQWRDFQSADGSWRKMRLSITPKGIRLRHVLFGDSWLIHSAKRTEAVVDQELALLEGVGDWSELQAIGRAIRDRIGLDFFGVDLGWKSDTEFVLFEANATMSILSYHNTPEMRRQDYVANIKRIEDDVWATLEDTAGVALKEHAPRSNL